MRLRHADQALERWARERARLGTIPAQDPVAIRRAICSKCGGGPMTLIAGRDHEDYARRHFREVCATCYKPWQPHESETLFVLKNVREHSKRIYGLEDRLAGVAKLGAIFKRLERKDRWMWLVWSAYVLGNVGTYEDLAAWGGVRHSRAKFRWDQYRVRSLVREAREFVEKELARSGWEAA